MRYAVLFLSLMMASPLVSGAERPRWSFELKGGQLTPKADGWVQYFPRTAPYYEMGLGYKPHRQIEFAIGVGLLQTRGVGSAPLHGTVAGHVTYESVPLQAAAIWRAVFDEDQWLVPYVGGGWTRISYRQRVEQQAQITGNASGYHVRGGLQLLLDRIDIRSANNIQDRLGVKNTYFFIEYQRTDVKKAGVQLGSTAVLGGLLVEF